VRSDEEQLGAVFAARLDKVNQLADRLVELEKEVERLGNYRDNVHRLIARVQGRLDGQSPTFWLLDDLDDGYYDRLPDTYFEAL
jgi:hypothetical protein